MIFKQTFNQSSIISHIFIFNFSHIINTNRELEKVWNENKYQIQSNVKYKVW